MVTLDYVRDLVKSSPDADKMMRILDAMDNPIVHEIIMKHSADSTYWHTITVKDNGFNYSNTIIINVHK